MKYGEVTFGQMEAIINKLGGMEGVQLLLSDKLEIKERQADFKVCFEVWKTIKLGTGLTIGYSFCKAIENGGMEVDIGASDSLGKSRFPVMTKETEVDLVKVTLAELGFKKGASRDNIYESAKEFGLELCPPEVGPQLRIQYRDQPNGERLLIGMESIYDLDDDPLVFCVECRNSVLWLKDEYSSFDSFKSADCQWVFVRPRKYQK